MSEPIPLSVASPAAVYELLTEMRRSGYAQRESWETVVKMLFAADEAGVIELGDCGLVFGRS